MKNKKKLSAWLGLLVVILGIVGFIYWNQRKLNEAKDAFQEIESICLNVEETYWSAGFLGLFPKELSADINNPIDAEIAKLFTYANILVYPESSEKCDAVLNIVLKGTAHKDKNVWAKATVSGYFILSMDNGKTYKKTFGGNSNLNIWIKEYFSKRVHSWVCDFCDQPADAPFSSALYDEGRGLFPRIVKMIQDIYGNEFLFNSLEDPDKEFKRHIVNVIGDLGIKELVEPLIELLKTDSGVDKRTVESALYEITHLRFDDYGDWFVWFHSQDK